MTPTSPNPEVTMKEWAETAINNLAYFAGVREGMPPEHSGVMYVSHAKDYIAALEAEVALNQRMFSRIDEVTPKADHICDEPGISFTEAVRRECKADLAERKEIR